MTRALPAIVALGVVVAGVALWRLAGDRRARWPVAVLAAYGALAFAHAVAEGITLSAALGGDGLFRPLPFVLQGAFIGAFVVLPIGWIVSLVRAGVPRFREGSPRRSIYQAVALTTSAGLVIASIPYDRRASAAVSSGSSAESTAVRLAMLENGLRAIEDGDRESPRDRWDPDYVVRVVGRDPRALFEWVRDNTFWIPYRGVLRGPVGVLMDRQGNSLDRALLLATLLEKAGHALRLAHGELTGEQATGLLPIVMAVANTGSMAVADNPSVSAPGTTPGTDAQRTQMQSVAARYHLDPSVVAQTIVTQQGGLARFQSDLNARVLDQARRLLVALPPRDPIADLNQRMDAARASLRDHWWVQLSVGQHWVDLDLVDHLPGTDPLQLQPQKTMSVSEVPRELYHGVLIRVVAERWLGGAVQETPILEHYARLIDLSGQTAVVQFWPGAWPSEMQRDINGPLGFKAAALEQRQWIAALAIGGRPIGHGIIREAADDPAPANPLTGLADAFARDALPQRPGRAPVTAVWIEYQVSTPGEVPHTTRRVVVDLLGAANRASRSAPQLPFGDAKRLERSIGLMSRVEILPLGYRIAPEFVAHLASESIATNKGVLPLVVGRDASATSEKIADRLAHASPPPSPLYVLALARLGLSASSDHVIVDRPNILSRHRYPAIVPAGLDLKAAFDIVANGVGVDLSVVDGIAERVQQGVLDTNAETLLSAAPARHNTADAFATSRDWSTVAVDGYVIVKPRSPASSQDEQSVGWWRIDPRTGETLGVGANGWGMGPEDSALFNMAVSAAGGFTFEYGLCQAFPQGLNLLKYLNEEYFDAWHPSWAAAAKSRSVGQVFEENNTVCLVSAIAGGIAATLPILLMTVKVKNMRVAVNLAERMALKEAEEQSVEQWWRKKLLEIPEERPIDPKEFELPPEPAPTVKTEVWSSKNNRNTLLPELKPNWKGDPAALLERERILEAAEARARSYGKQSADSIGEYIRYQQGRLLDPKYNVEIEAALRSRAELDFEHYSEAVNELERLDPLRKYGDGGAGRNGPPPPPAQPRGNDNLTVDAQQVAGAAGANNALK